MFQRILFATEFGPASAEAEKHTIGLARATGASCHLLHVIEAIHLEDDPQVESLYSTLEERAAPRFEASLGRFRDAGIPCDGQLEIGERWRSILATAHASSCDLIVIGARRFEPEVAPHFGTTSHKVFMTTSIPLLVVPSSEKESGAKKTARSSGKNS